MLAFGYCEETEIVAPRTNITHPIQSAGNTQRHAVLTLYRIPHANIKNAHPKIADNIRSQIEVWVIDTPFV